MKQLQTKAVVYVQRDTLNISGIETVNDKTDFIHLLTLLLSNLIITRAYHEYGDKKTLQLKNEELRAEYFPLGCELLTEWGRMDDIEDMIYTLRFKRKEYLTDNQLRLAERIATEENLLSIFIQSVVRCYQGHKDPVLRDANYLPLNWYQVSDDPDAFRYKIITRFEFLGKGIKDMKNRGEYEKILRYHNKFDT